MSLQCDVSQQNPFVDDVQTLRDLCGYLESALIVVEVFAGVQGSRLVDDKEHCIGLTDQVVCIEPVWKCYVRPMSCFMPTHSIEMQASAHPFSACAAKFWHSAMHMTVYSGSGKLSCST